MRKSQMACERKRRRQERERKNMQQMRLVLLTTICVREQGRRDILRRTGTPAAGQEVLEQTAALQALLRFVGRTHANSFL
jgi:hypothetical protein